MPTTTAPPPSPTPLGSIDLAARLTDKVATEHPVLADAPDVARLVARLRAADLLIAHAIDDLIELQDTGAAEALTGVGPTGWIGIVARRTSTDTRMLATAATMLRRLPSLRAAFHTGAVSWAQVRTVCLATHRLPAHLDDAIDGALAKTIDAGVEADAITHVVGQVLASIESTGETSPSAPDEFLAMQPRLDGTGGRLFGELGPEAWAIADAALNAPPARSVDPTQPERTANPAREDAAFGEQMDPLERRAAIRRRGRQRLDRLVDILDASLADRPTTDPGAPAGDRSKATPRVILRADLDTLLDRGRTPGSLLHQLLGGVVHVDHRTARRLIDTRGGDLRTVIVDDGRVVGVGRQTRVVPGWLRDATLALHDVCSAPGCATAARASDTDHARPWHAHRHGDLAGTTDIDQLASHQCAMRVVARLTRACRPYRTTAGSRASNHANDECALNCVPGQARAILIT
jgi:hypothetical protein